MTARKPWAKTPATDRHLSGARWQKLRRHILNEHPLCRMCEAQGRVTVATVLDHITPRSRGGTDALSNLQGLCRLCHRVKSCADRGHTVHLRPEIGIDGLPIKGTER